MNLSSPLTPYLYRGHNRGEMTSQIVSQATQFLQVISPDLDDNQVEYLSWRVCGFSASESLSYSRLEPKHLAEWVNDDRFVLLEKQALGELRTKFAEDVIDTQQQKNAKLVSGIDENVMVKAFLGGIGSLTPQEFTYVTQIRNQFNPDVRRLLGDKGETTIAIPASFDEMALMIRRSNSNVNNQAQDSPVQEGIIEAEYRESPALPEGPEVGTSEEDDT